MLKAAVQAISAGVPLGMDRPPVAGRDDFDEHRFQTMREVGISERRKAAWRNLRNLRKSCGVDGVVASGRRGESGSQGGGASSDCDARCAAEG